MDTEETKVEEDEPSDKVVKSDDAKIPIHLWNNIIAHKFMEY